MYQHTAPLTAYYWEPDPLSCEPQIVRDKPYNGVRVSLSAIRAPSLVATPPEQVTTV